jgi:putative ABC transport system permease protein
VSNAGKPFPMDNQPTPQARVARTWRRYLRFWGSRPEADVDDELQFHMDMRMHDYMQRGMNEADARAAAAQRFGDTAHVHAELVAISSRRERRTSRAQLIDGFLQDMRFALRTFGRQRGWTAVAITTLALGIGATTAVFSVVNSLILHPISYPHADRIVNVWLEPIRSTMTGVTVTVTADADAVKTWLVGSHSFDGLEPYSSSDVTVEQAGAAPATLSATYVTPTFPRFADQRILLGRMFTQQEVDDKAPVVLLSEATWHTRFGSDTAVIGKSLTIDDKLYTIIGVAPGSLSVPHLSQAKTDLWFPIRLERGGGFLMVGRLRDGVSAASATRELDALYARSPAVGKGPPPFHVRLMGPREMVSFKQSLIMLTGAVALVLLIACTNVAHLLLARSASRQRELAIRQALGAGLPRVFAQMLTESIALAVAGCVIGAVLGWTAVRLLVRLRPENLEELSVAHMDTTVLWVIALLALATGIGFGLFAAIQSWRHSTHESLKTGALTTSQSRSQGRMRALLVVTEMALSTTLLVAASLMVRSVVNLRTTSPGFDPRGLYALNADLPHARYPDSTSQSAFYRDLIERVRAIPAVDEITIAGSAPPGFNFMIGGLQAEGEPEPKAGTTAFNRFVSVSPDYFRTMRLPIVAGRAYQDSTGEPNAIMVNEGFVKAHWPGQSGVGKRLKFLDFSGHGEWSTIIGVVADAATGGLTDDRSSPTMYTQEKDGPSGREPTIIVRAKQGVDLLPALRGAVASLDPRLPPPRLTNIEDAMNASAAEPRFTMLLLVSFTVLALVLAAVGLYGVMSYAVAQRTREIGIRIALGATKRAVSRDVIRRGVVLAGVGAVLGLTGAWWATKIVEKMLYGVTRTDPVSFAVGGTVLLATAIAACVVPMHRAASVDPLIAMRAD